MAFNEENLFILQNIEFVIVDVYRQNPKMTDYSVITALEAAIEHYRAKMHGSQERKVNFSPLDEEVFGRIRSICDWRLGRITEDELPELDETETPETIIDCLKSVLSSVKKSNKTGGRQGYLTFISRFVR
ncbi:MAG TPA: hypothetical protein VHO03_08405 [Ignavibacteriales bacterium]|nr:hypothetical protein [Ignavibacteriales bacterium]